jgi:hypothetical protein
MSTTITPTKVLFVGPQYSSKSKTFYELENYHLTTTPIPYTYKMTLGVQVCPFRLDNKLFSIWDTWHRATNEDYLIWGGKVDIVVIFGNDFSYENRMKFLFPNKKIIFFDQNTFISDLLTM